MKKIVLSLILAITALSASAFGGCSNGQTYGGEKMAKQSEQTMEESNCDNCDNPDCDGTCKDDEGKRKNGCPDENQENIQGQKDEDGTQKSKNSPRARMPHNDGNRKMPRKPMPVPPSNNGNN